MRARAGSAPLGVVAASVVAVGIALLLSVSAGAGAAEASGRRPPALSTIVLPEIGFGYSVTSQGPLDASQFPTGSPSASAAAGALSTLGESIGSFQRSWQDATGVNQVQDLVVRFPTSAGARAFVVAARHALANGEIVSTRPLSSIPGAARTTYFASTDQAGVGQTITLSDGDYAAVLSFFSGASGNPAPITTASAIRVAKAQYEAMASATRPVQAKRVAGGGLSASYVAWMVFAVAVLAAAVSAPLVLRRRREVASHR